MGLVLGSSDGLSAVVKEKTNPKLPNGIAVGMTVEQINGESMEMLSKKEVLERIKAAGRPLTIAFKACSTSDQGAEKELPAKQCHKAEPDTTVVAPKTKEGELPQEGVADTELSAKDASDPDTPPVQSPKATEIITCGATASGFRGVYKQEIDCRFCARLYNSNTQQSEDLGVYETSEEAAIKYAQRHRELYGHLVPNPVLSDGNKKWEPAPPTTEAGAILEFLVFDLAMMYGDQKDQLKLKKKPASKKAKEIVTKEKRQLRLK